MKLNLELAQLKLALEHLSCFSIHLFMKAVPTTFGILAAIVCLNFKTQAMLIQTQAIILLAYY